MAVGKIGRDLDPFPTLGADALRFALELLGNETIEKADVLQPAAIVTLEQVAHDGAAGRGIIVAGELRALVRGANRAFGQQTAKLVGLFIVGALNRAPDLLLALVVRAHGEAHELVERHAVLGIDVEQLRRHGSETQALLDDGDADEEGGGDLLLALAFFAQREKARN